MAAEAKASIFYRCNLFIYYLVSIDERPANIGQYKSEVVSICKCPPKNSRALPQKFGAQKHLIFTVDERIARWMHALTPPVPPLRFIKIWWTLVQ